MHSLYALHLSLSVTIPAIQPRLRLSVTNRLRSVFHDGQRMAPSLKAVHLANPCIALCDYPIVDQHVTLIEQQGGW
ncbi:MAG: hypothetical protein KZQ66_06725 [Candidatus Thiodiazotropha sp. (ex Lucinoma aequizonata)]|nr:hypothetical protein [Candidatus Thiodiazotropha sp. (ex Lucinoma aequizonata)]MCU7887225.1 hypothetical protein [Candidatus Thiodiazotropha sp. (ex Lucinoma aequizonata)]MCU7895585.1 hypothetical protein [Candidatus Thiodiazotropha sp. (ex Lucinoma aequizonata)]MCU7898997.1 hypothetical protein [Candidatus Thiodiazotropha sp. (ex Lucinoma aequizonata)]MCU7901718.1 hypothetical protein [Candidatus Thiodiazotropha sp. (ex Lucinoma aequizonata)]